MENEQWYNNLKKSPLNPPPWVFGIVWPILYTLMAASFILVWRTPTSKAHKQLGLTAFIVQLILNLSWSPTFFRYKQLNLSLVIIILTWISIGFTGVLFYRVNPLAAYLLVPYWIWVSFAIYLNAYIVASYSSSPPTGSSMK